ncbi:hypothetical protein EJ04DRAFT_559010 [Polyplosphaeria fusca]|uniref:Uncharacterized protein n=1 Tax=Polyplosphaeria fusca TaxID=682080 RepID=A0A9P4RBJ4_9PLEO|nr:hypothetical protein EJ04DRAFT_559010 [Polyplosphaeria fusca]
MAPESPFYGKQVQDALTKARITTANLATALSTSHLHLEAGSTVRNLHQQATILSDFQPPSTRVVGLVGDSGVGKSSLINSLLDKEELARASNSGAACTCVVTEYHHHTNDDFKIDIEYFSDHDLKSQYEQLLHDYRRFQRAEHAEGTDAKELEYLGQRADLAIKLFRASFGRRLEETRGIIDDLPIEQSVDIMMGWVAQVLPPAHSRGESNTVRETFNGITECSNRLAILTSELNERGGKSLWPFIKKLKVYLKSHILSKGLIIADLPGLRDLNTARQNVTERYVRQCHQVYAVARIGRATTDAGVKEVFDLARRASLSNVGVICTQSDDIRANEAKHDWPTERPMIEQMERNITTQKLRRQEVEEQVREYEEDLELLDEVEMGEYRELQKELRTIDRAHRNMRFERFQYLIHTRNTKIFASLQALYGGRTLQAFCVSNSIYWDHRGAAVGEALPSLQLSGIIRLRRHCIGIVADSQLRATNTYLQDEIPAFLGSVELWIQAGSGDASAENKQQILDAVAVVQQGVNQLTSPVSSQHDIAYDMTSSFKDHVKIYMRQRAQDWCERAGEASMARNGYHHSSYSAFCRNFGTHWTKAIGHACWNEEAVASMKTDLSDRWDDFSGDAELYLDGVTERVKDVFDGMLEATTGASNARHALQILARNLRRRKAILTDTLSIANEDFQAKLTAIKTDAVSPVRTSIIGQLIEPSYRNANMEYGTNSDRRRKNIMNAGFSSPALFTSHRRQLQTQFVAETEVLQQQLIDAVAQQLGFITADLDTLRDDNAVLESERNPEFRLRLVGEVREARAVMMRLVASIPSVGGETREAQREVTPGDGMTY